MPLSEIVFVEQFDLHHPAVLRQVRRWLASGLVDYVHFGTPCAVWSRPTPVGARGARVRHGRA
eukprot:5387746-Lingulodinium_polyedra.AAC.1